MPLNAKTALPNAHFRKRRFGMEVDPELLVTPLDIPEATIGRCSIKHIHRPAGASEALASMRTAFFQGDPPVKVAFPFPTRWHQLVEEGRGIWTTDLPIERVQQERDVQGFKGHVLCTGLGVGLMPTLLALRPEIASVTLVERNPDVIRLVQPHLGSPKLRIYCADAYDYLAETDSRFDFVFHDIWQGDGLMTLRHEVVPLKRATRRVLARKRYDGNRIRCWNIGVMLGQLQMQLLRRLRGEYIGAPEELRGVMTAPPKKQLALPDLCLTANYWRWWYAARPDRAVAHEAAKAYCHRSFGSGSWEARWGELRHCDREEQEDDDGGW